MLRAPEKQGHQNAFLNNLVSLRRSPWDFLKLIFNYILGMGMGNNFLFSSLDP